MLGEVSLSGFMPLAQRTVTNCRAMNAQPRWEFLSTSETSADLRSSSAGTGGLFGARICRRRNQQRMHSQCSDTLGESDDEWLPFPPEAQDVIEGHYSTLIQLRLPVTRVPLLSVRMG